MKSYDNNGPARSALADYPGASVPNQPRLSAIIPLYNEIDHIKILMGEIVAQDYPGLVEIWFVDGESTDGTYAELQAHMARDPRIRLLQNPRRSQAAAINLASAHATGEIIIRLDGHARYAPDVMRQSVEALLKTGAGGVGAIARPLQATTLMGQSIVAAHESKIGVGVAKFRQESAEGWVDTVWNGCYWKHVMERVGPMREDLPRHEDNEYHARLRALGYGLYLEPAIKAYYQPRQSLGALWRQYYANGIGVAQTLVENRQAVSIHHLIPLAFVSSLITTGIAASIYTPARILWQCIMGLYSTVVVFFSFSAWRKKPGRYATLMPLVFITLHTSYGLGSINGLIALGWRMMIQRQPVHPPTEPHTT